MVADQEENRAAAYTLAFHESARALDAQERAVTELRSRAGVLIAAAAIVTSFFGARDVLGDGLGPWGWTAVVAFLAVGATVLCVLWPRTDWSFSANATAVIAEYVEPEALPLAAIHRDLALHRALSYRANADQLGRLFLVFRVGLICLIVEVAAWVAALVERS